MDIYNNSSLDFTFAHAQPTDSLLQKAAEASELSNIAEQEGVVRIIVEFAPMISAEVVRPEPAILARVKVYNRSMQDQIIVRHFGNADASSSAQSFDRALRRMDIGPMFAINVNKAELEQLAADSQVRRIYYDRPDRLNLNNTVPLIGMTGASGAYALGATGNGYAVGIIDTGVQVDHHSSLHRK